MPQTVQKVCRVCGEDVSRQRRTKDQHGNYYCQPCYQAAATPASTQPSGDPDNTSDYTCSACGSAFDANGVYDDHGSIICKGCYELRAAAASDRLNGQGSVTSGNGAEESIDHLPPKSRKSAGVELLPNEVVLMQGGANYEKGWETVGGKRLVLTTFRLFFESHKINIQTGGLTIDLREIASVEPVWTKLLGLIPLVPNTLLVGMTDGQQHRFVVWGNRKWAEAIQGQQRAVLR